MVVFDVDLERVGEVQMASGRKQGAFLPLCVLEEAERADRKVGISRAKTLSEKVTLDICGGSSI